MKKQTSWLLNFILIFTFFCQTLWSDPDEEPTYVLDELIVSASRNPLPIAQVGSTVTVISNQEIEKRQVRFVADILRSIPGLAVSRTGNYGSQTQVRIRGAEGNHTLVIIDGIEVNDPSTGSEFDFAHMLASDIEKLEIIRGPQSALFGSDSIGGVIKIVTNHGRKEDLSFSGSSEGGSFDTAVFNSSVSSGSDWYNFSVLGSRYQTHGNNISRSGNEDDGYENNTLGLSAEIAPIENLTMDINIRYTDGKKEIDTQDFDFPATPTEGQAVDTDNEAEVSQFYGRLQGKIRLLENRWVHIFGAAITDTENNNFANGVFIGSNEGERKKYNYQTSYILELSEVANSSHTITIAYEREELGFKAVGPTPQSSQNQRQDIDKESFIGEYQVNLFQQFSLSSGIRHDNNQRFDDDTTYRFTLAYLIPEFGIKLHGSHGTGTTDPSFTELFGFFPGSFIGNPNLKPEKSDSFDIGMEKKFKGGRIVINLVYFSANLKDEINTTFESNTFMSTVENSDDESERRGIEVSASIFLTDNLTMTGSYTYTDAEDPDGKKEIRRAQHIASAVINYTFLESRANLNIAVNYNGNQKDNQFLVNEPFLTRVTLDDYFLVNIAGRFQLTEKVELFARIENLLDEDYEEVFSFSTPGIGFFGGIRLKY